MKIVFIKKKYILYFKVFLAFLFSIRVTTYLITYFLYLIIITFKIKRTSLLISLILCIQVIIN